MAYTFGKSKYKETYDYWELWNKKNKNVEKHFLSQWEGQFKAIRRICKDIEKTGEFVKDGDMDDEPYYCSYIGTVFNVTPSGKYYVPFASSNVSVKEAAIDQFWYEEYEKILEEENCWHGNGEGDPCDMFICKAYDKPEKPEISPEDYERILSEIINEELVAADLLAIPGIYEILSEYYNNDILERYESED